MPVHGNVRSGSKALSAAGAEEKARRDDLGSRERNQVATAEHIGQSPLSRYEDLIARPARSPPPNGGGDYEGLCCAAQQILHAKCRWVKSRHWIGARRCPLYSQKRTLPTATRMSALCQKQTSVISFDYPIGGSEIRARSARRLQKGPACKSHCRPRRGRTGGCSELVWLNQPPSSFL